jgi:hypothetical protein
MLFINWPPYSPDLKPIKHVWRAVKAILKKRGAPIFDLKNNKVDMALFRSEITAAWEAIPEGLIRRLILTAFPRKTRRTLSRGGGPFFQLFLGIGRSTFLTAPLNYRGPDAPILLRIHQPRWPQKSYAV